MDTVDASLLVRGQEVRPRHGEDARAVHHRGGGRQEGEHGPPGHRWLPRRQRRRPPALRAHQEGPLQELLRALAGEVPEQDQRHHAQEVAAPVQPHAL